MITHAKISIIPDSSNPDEIHPSDWNANHVISGIYYNTITVFSNTFSRVFTHGLGQIPDSYSITPLNVEGVLWYISNETITPATIYLATTQDIDVDFKIKAE